LSHRPRRREAWPKDLRGMEISGVLGVIVKVFTPSENQLFATPIAVHLGEGIEVIPSG
jgi:hypothetical protein